MAGARIGDISHAIGSVSRSAGTASPRGSAGTASAARCTRIRTCPNEGRPGRGFRLRPGLALAIEPMLIAGGADAFGVGPDGWALRAADGRRAAHVEHSVAVADSGPRILTLP